MTVVFGGPVGLLDVELRNGATELVWVTILEKMVKVGMTRGFAVELIVRVGGRSAGIDGGTVGGDVGTVGVGMCTLGVEPDTVGVDGSAVGAESETVIVTPALSQRPTVTLTVS